MSSLVLYCKSYKTDLRRVERLARSIQQFNQDGMPFYISVPSPEVDLFTSRLKNLDVVILDDASIIRASPRLDLEKMGTVPGHIAQQIIKSEFWRLDLSASYVCLDSDAVFIRPFQRGDFLASDGFPYSVIDEAHELIDDALRQGKLRIVDHFAREAEQMQSVFQRAGKRYSFGPFPLVWHRAVWKSLEDNHLAPRGMSFYDAIMQCPIESRWYGEALLAYKAIPLHPSQAFFKVYHYAWQYDKDKRRGITQEQLSRTYSGLICQSSWEREMDWPQEGGHFLSRWSRRIRRQLGRI